MPSPWPGVPSGQNTAGYPTARLEWVERVHSNFEEARKAPAPVRLVFDGDSITDSWRKAGKKVWDENYAKLNAFNFGISADRTQHVLWRLSQGQMRGLQPKLIAILIGTNNQGRNSDGEVIEGVARVVEEYRKACPESAILLQAIFPRGWKADDPARAKIRAINEGISKLADGDRVIYLDFGSKFLQPDGSISKEIMPDALHLSEKGYSIWAEAIRPVIERFFKAD